MNTQIKETYFMNHINPNRVRIFSSSIVTRSTNVVRNAGCARSRYTQKFFVNELMNELIN